jgi:hypothetical protein
MGRVRFLHFTSAITNIDMSKTSLYLRNNKMYEQQFVGECAAGIPGLITVRAKKAQELKKGRFATPLSNTVVREQDKMHHSPLYTTMATSTLYSAVLELNVCIPPLCLSKTLLLREDGVLFKWKKARKIEDEEEGIQAGPVDEEGDRDRVLETAVGRLLGRNADVIGTLRQDFLPPTGRIVPPAPHNPIPFPEREAEPLDEYTSIYLPTRSFPCLFPFGHGDISNNVRVKDVTFHDAVQHYAWLAKQQADGKWYWG